MKAKMLKIAGVKSEAEFYKKFPDEESFMKVHGKEFKKALLGAKLKKAQPGINQLPTQGDQLNPTQGFQPTLSGLWSSENELGDIIGEVANSGLEGAQAGFKKGDRVGKLNNLTKFVEPAIDVAQGLSMLKGQKEAVRKAKQNMKLTEVQAQAATSVPFNMGQRQYIRPEDVVFNPEEMYPTYGTGTPAVHAKSGAKITGTPTEIQNMYNPGTLYTNLEEVKQYQSGGGIDWKGLANTDGNTIAGTLGGLIGNKGGAPTAGSKIGGGVGQAAGMLIGGPVGGMVGKFAGTAIGGLLDQSDEKIKRYNEQANQSIAQVVGQQVGVNMRSRFAGTMKDGGWISHDWQPQLITRFGEHKLSDLLKPDPTMNTLRTGGQIRQNYMSPDEIAQMQMGGELQTHWGGYAEPISQNPYLPEGGETVMFRGQSHEESDGKGNTGIGVTYGNNPVEVEHGEPAVKLQDGSSGDSSLVVYGNLPISKLSAMEIGDPKAKGKKFKNYVADLSKKEEKNNKIIEKSTESLDNLNLRSPYEKLKFDSLKAMILGGNMKLKDIAEKKMNAAAVQNAINDTADEYGLIADDLAKGKIKQAKHGASIEKAQDGKYMGVNNPVITGLYDLLEKKGYNIKVSSGYRPGDPKRHGSHGAIDIQFPDFGAASYQKILEDPEVVSYMMKNGITALNEYDKDIVARINANRNKGGTKSTGNHIHFGFDKGTSISEQFRKDVAAKYPDLISSIPKETPMQPYKEQVSGTTELPTLKKEDYEYLKNLYNEAKKQGRGQAVEKFQKEYHRLAPEYAKSVIGREPITNFGKRKGYSNTDLRSNEDSIFGQRTEQYMAALDRAMQYGPVSVNKLPSEIKPLPSAKPLEPKAPVLPTINAATPAKSKFDWMTLYNQVLPFLRPSDDEALDPMELSGEMYAMSQNQLEPVWAQKLTPRLSTPYDISLQDILNENKATLKRQQGLLGYNPAAQASLAAAEYDANQKVLGEQFRLNQAEKQRVYEQNRNILNQYDTTNMGILDTQYGRQAEALSKTKATTQAALNSISSKIAQNKLENRTLQVYENLYNYRYDPKFRAINMNPLMQWNTQIAGPLTELDKQEKKTAKKGKIIKKNSRNGSIVKAIKNL